MDKRWAAAERFIDRWGPVAALASFLPLLIAASMNGASMGGGVYATTGQLDNIQVLTAGGNLVIQDSTPNTLLTIVDAGTTGALRFVTGGQIEIANTDTFEITDGTNTLVAIADSGATGNMTLGQYTASTYFLSNGVLMGDMGVNSGQVIYTNSNSNDFAVTSANDDGASAVAVTLGAFDDYTTAGAKAVSFGDDIGATFDELAYVMVGSVLGANNWRVLTAGGNLVVQESAGNAGATFFDDGTTMSMQLTGTKSRSTITLSGGTGTATVNSGAICTCTDTTANASVQCNVSGTTLTATGTTTDVIAYLCLGNSLWITFGAVPLLAWFCESTWRRWRRRRV